MYPYYRRTLIPLFEEVHDLINRNDVDPYDWHAYQLKVLDLLIRIEKRQRLTRQEISENKSVLLNRLPRIESKHIKQRIKSARMKIESYRHIQFVCRSLIDAFIFSKVDTWDLKPLVFKQRSGFLSGKSGLPCEIEVAEELAKRGFLAVLTDLTNTVRHGDIMVIGPGIYELIEVKKGGVRNDRDRRQIGNIGKIIQYIETDIVHNLYENIPVMKRVAVHSEEHHYRNVIPGLMKHAYELGMSHVNVENGVDYLAVYYDSVTPEEVVAEAKRLARNPMIFFFGEGRYFDQAYIPFSLMISDPLVWLDFYEEKCSIVVVLDMDVIENSLEKHELKCSFLDDDYAFLQVRSMKSAQSSQDSGTLSISRHFFFRLVFEFLSLDWLLTEVVERFHRLEKLPDEEGIPLEEAPESMKHLWP